MRRPTLDRRALLASVASSLSLAGCVGRDGSGTDTVRSPETTTNDETVSTATATNTAAPTMSATDAPPTETETPTPETPESYVPTPYPAQWEQTPGEMLGGGDGYDRTVERSDADHVARTKDELTDTLIDAAPGEIVFVPGDEEIAVGVEEFRLEDITLASDRGVSGSTGARITTEDDVKATFRLYGNSRITGLEFRGAHPGDDTSGISIGTAIRTYGPAEIDNCELHGVGKEAIKCLGTLGVPDSEKKSSHVHHNHIHHNNQDGRGYGVSITGNAGYPLIEFNYFYYNRHSVTTDGEAVGYECRYNHFGPVEAMWPIDAHHPAGTKFEVYNNVVEPWEERAYDGEDAAAVIIRGVPDEDFHIHNNWLWNPREPDPDGPSATYPDQAIHQSSGCCADQFDDQPHEFVNVTFHDNYYGEDADVTYSEIIPGYDGWWSQ